MHKAWIDQVEQSLSPLFDGSRKLYYSHWETGEALLDFDLELEKLVALTDGLDNYIIFAKSAGTLLTMRGVKEGKLNPSKCLFTGVPVTWARNNHFPVELWMEGYSVPTTYIHQTMDRTCSITELNTVLKEHNVQNATIIEVPGVDHNYDDFALLKVQMAKLLS